MFRFLSSWIGKYRLDGRYDTEIFNKIESYKPLNIYFVKEISDNKLSKINTYIDSNSNEYFIVINIIDDNFKENMLYSLMNTFENNMNDLYIMGKIEKPFSNWNKYNPSNFSYSNLANNDLLYTIKNVDAYFINNNSKVNAKEDRAILFGNLLNINLMHYPKLLKKVIYLKSELEKVYPSIKNSLIFNNLNIE